MRRNKDYIYKWHPNYYIYSILFLFGFLLALFFFGSLQSYKLSENIPSTIFLGVLTFLLIFPAFVLFFRERSRSVYFGTEKVWQRIKGELYEWRWDEMTTLEMPYNFWRARLVGQDTVIRTNPDYMPLVFLCGPVRERLFIKICPNESILKQIEAENHRLLYADFKERVRRP